MAVNKFSESEQRFKKWRNEVSNIVGLCNWEVVMDRFKLQCWNDSEKGLVIIQIWENGDGFHEYYLNEEKRTTSSKEE